MVPSSRLCISNIAWSEAADEAVMHLLQSKGIELLEVAPTKAFGSWAEADDDRKVMTFRRRLQKKGIRTRSLQAILYNKPDLELFLSDTVREMLLTHVLRVVDLARNLGAKIIVWVSPKQRQIRGQLYGDCFDIACSWFRRLGRSAHEKGVTIGIEANAKEYGCDFCFTTSQAAELVRVIDCPGVKLLLDTANMHLANDDVDSCIVSNKDIICHVQVSEPGLTNFESPVVNHAAVAKALVQIGYDGTLSIEMREEGTMFKLTYSLIKDFRLSRTDRAE